MSADTITLTHAECAALTPAPEASDTRGQTPGVAND